MFCACADVLFVSRTRALPMSSDFFSLALTESHLGVIASGKKFISKTGDRFCLLVSLFAILCLHTDSSRTILPKQFANTR